MRHRDRAICLRTTDYSETSQVVWFLARDIGLVHLMAKGSKRAKSKSGGAIDMFSEGDLVFSTTGSGAMGTLIEFFQTEALSGLRRSSDTLFTGTYMLELTTNMLAEFDPHPEVFDLLHNGLARLAQLDAPAQAVLAYFQWRLLVNVGLIGELAACGECGCDLKDFPPNESYFCSERGGLLCRDCELSVVEKFRLDSNTLAGLAALQAAQAGKASGQKAAMSPAQAAGVNRTLAYHITQQLGKQLKTAKYVIK